MRDKVFISYSHEDQKWLDDFVAMLKPAVRADMLDVWTDKKITTGQNWKEDIRRALDEAQAALLLVSDHFLASEYIIQDEIPSILESAQRRGLSVHWVPISSSLWEKTKLSDIQASWDPQKPLDRLSDAERKNDIRQISLDLSSKLGQGSRVSRGERHRLREAVQRLSPDLVLEEFVASGDSSIVFHGRRGGEFSVAVKIFVDSPLHEEDEEEVVRHARVAMELKHPAFIKIYDVQLREKPRSVVTEYVDEAITSGDRRPAPTLAHVLQTEAAPFNVDRVMIILRKLAEALSEAHERKMIYGVLSSSNVLMQDALSPRLSAFGFWSYQSKNADIAGNFVVNREMLSYMPPEQFYGQPITEQSDQYALGLLALEMLEGSRRVTVRCAADFALKEAFFANPFEKTQDWETRHPSLAEVVKRMLSRRPEDRWPSLSEVTMKLARLECEAVVRAKNSYRECCEGRADFWAAFYNQLFDLCDQLQLNIRAMFGTRNMNAQYQLLDTAVQSLLNFPATPIVEPTVLSATAARHRQLPLEQRHYEIFGQALLDTLRQKGESEEGLRAWEVTIAPGLEYMKTRSAKLTSDVESIERKSARQPLEVGNSARASRRRRRSMTAHNLVVSGV